MSETSPQGILSVTWAIGRPNNPILFEQVAPGIKIGHVEDYDPQYIDAIWARTVYASCERRVIESAFAIPLVHQEGRAIIWHESEALVLNQKGNNTDVQIPDRPDIKHPVILSMGGPSGVGKSSVVRKMQERLPGEVLTYPPFTSRPARGNEKDGIDYHFRTKEQLEEAREDIRYMGFVEARGNWYWINPSILLKSVWHNDDKIHVLFNTQRQEIELRRAFFPELKWIWLEADAEDIRQRLVSRGDTNVEQSLEFNRRLATQDNSDVIALRLDNRLGEFDQTVDRLITYTDLLRTRRKICDQ